LQLARVGAPATRSAREPGNCVFGLYPVPTRVRSRRLCGRIGCLLPLCRWQGAMRVCAEGECSRRYPGRPLTDEARASSRS
jgi:hypothetical protein